MIEERVKVESLTKAVLSLESALVKAPRNDLERDGVKIIRATRPIKK